MRIKALSSAVANQIAAGEVIENPASVVKELLENALDANATSITIDIGFGGLNQIKISDNGTGIVADDLPLAIAPHATSKLTQLADLSTLTSMGFRGEALASIASISRLTLSSKPAAQDHAMMLHVDGPSVELSPCARNQGTTIDVRDLFYNAPVRRRFLKSERSEYIAIEHIVKRFALSAPLIAMTLKHNGKQIFELPAATDEYSLRLRIKKLLGKEFIDNAVTLDVERSGMRLNGWISGPAYHRSQNDKQWIYLNQRMIKDKLIHHALKQAYEGQLYPGRHFACLLYLSMPTAEVDVNVHPTKHEVRFQEPRLVHDFIGSQIAEALMHSSPSEAIVASDYEAIQRSENELLDCFAPQAMTETKTAPPMVVREDYVSRPQFAAPATRALSAPHHPELGMMGRRYNYNQDTPTIPWFILNHQFGLLTWNGLPYLLDIHLAQHQYYLSIIEQQTKPLLSRPLLVPITMDCDSDNGNHLQQLLAPFGVYLELKNERLNIRTIPVCMPQLDVKKLLQLVITTWPEAAELSEIFAACQLSDVTQLNPDEKNALGDFIVRQLQISEPRYCLRLDIEQCRNLMNIY